MTRGVRDTHKTTGKYCLRSVRVGETSESGLPGVIRHNLTLIDSSDDGALPRSGRECVPLADGVVHDPPNESDTEFRPRSPWWSREQTGNTEMVAEDTTDPMPDPGNFKDVQFYPMLNFGLFWAALLKIPVLAVTYLGQSYLGPGLLGSAHLKMSGFTQHWILAFFGALLPSSRCPGFAPPEILANFWPIPTFSAARSTFFGRSGGPQSWIFTPPEILAIFGPPSQTCPWSFPNFWAGFVAIHSVHCLLFSSCLLLSPFFVSRRTLFARCTLCSVWHGCLYKWSLDSLRLHKAFNTQSRKQRKHRRKPRWTEIKKRKR